MATHDTSSRIEFRREALFALAYFLVYITYLFARPESEFVHWLTLVALPFGLVFIYQAKITTGITLRDSLASVGLARGNLTRGIVWAILLGMALSALQLVLSRRSREIWQTMSSRKIIYLFPIVLLLMLATAGFTEEFFFRGVLQTRLEKLFRSKLLAVVGASLLFGLYHLPYAYMNPHWPSHGNWAAALAAAFGQGVPIGLILGTLYVRSRNNLLACVLLHSLINSLPAMTMIKMHK